MVIPMEKIELKTMHSFRRAKSDIIDLQSKVIELGVAQKRLLTKIANMDNEHQRVLRELALVKLQKRVAERKAKSVSKATAKRTMYIASKEGKKFHKKNCPYAQNIKPKLSIKFKSKTRPLNLGLKPCNCVKN